MGRKRKSKGKRKKLHGEHVLDDSATAGEIRDLGDAPASPGPEQGDAPEVALEQSGTTAAPTAEDRVFTEPAVKIPVEPLAAVGNSPNEPTVVIQPSLSAAEPLRSARSAGVTTATPDAPPLAPQLTPHLAAPLAGPIRRLLAALYDLMLVLVVWLYTVSLTTAHKLAEFSRPLTEESDLSAPFAPLRHSLTLALVALVVFTWLYLAGLEATSSGMTVGKRLVGIRAVDEEGRRLRLSRATLRLIGKIASVGTFGLGFALLLFSSKRQALHDRLAKTLVLRVT